MTTRFIDHLSTGVHASRPAATAVPTGTLYSCTTHSLVYQSDGSAWSTWATLGSTGGGNTVRLVYSGGAYPTRTGGTYYEYIGPTVPSGWSAGDTWIKAALT